MEDSTLILGDLGKRCLLEERRSFSQEKLDKLEKVRTNGRGVSATRVGLVFMEGTDKKLSPKHQYHFLHRKVHVLSCCMLRTVNEGKHPSITQE